jgi:diguanylate cyclase (GGDEF)-like protein/PAS domain S-box-containing protein
MQTKVDAALRRLVATNLVAILFTDLSGNILSADDSFLNLLGYTSTNLPLSIHDLTPPEHHRLDEEAFEKLMAFGACAPFEKDFFKQDGTVLPVLFGAAMHDEEIACFVVDVSHNKQTQEKLNHLAYHDALTDLPNRVFFQERLEQALTYSERHGTAFAVLSLDLDRFKQINDVQGHAVGDIVLVELANRLKGELRMEDTVARLGGDEFAIIQTGLNSADEPAALARRILRTVSKPFRLDGVDYELGISIGIASCPRNGHSSSDLMKKADVALYQAKRSGRARFCTFEETARSAA